VTKVTESHILTNHNNNSNWPNFMINVVCLRHHGYYQLPLKLTT